MTEAEKKASGHQAALKDLADQNNQLEAEKLRLERSLAEMTVHAEVAAQEKERLARENVELAEKHARELDNARLQVRLAHTEIARVRELQDGGARCDSASQL
jgi:hypothetical protein